MIKCSDNNKSGNSGNFENWKYLNACCQMETTVKAVAACFQCDRHTNVLSYTACMGQDNSKQKRQ